MKTFFFRLFFFFLVVNAESGFAQTNGSSPQVIADEIFTAWYTAYNMESVQGYFWDNAEMMEVVLDAFETTKDPKYKTMFEAMYKNFTLRNGTDWQENKYNDDIAWMVLVSVRAASK